MHTLKYLFLTLLYSLFFLACKETPTKSEMADGLATNSVQTSNTTSNRNTPNVPWAHLINQKSESISDLYSDQAIKILEDGTAISGNEEIEDHYLSASLSVKNTWTDSFIVARKNRGLDYEMGGFSTAESDHQTIIIWETKDSIRKRVFEFAAASKSSEDIMTKIDERRRRWIELCNQHNASNLINEMYSKNTLYYNHKPLIIGREALIKEYGYMNDEKYQLNLTPIIKKQVNKDLVFEIGQCAGSYGGKYIIIWRMEDSGMWEVFIDSNI